MIAEVVTYMARLLWVDRKQSSIDTIRYGNNTQLSYWLVDVSDGCSCVTGPQTDKHIPNDVI